MFKAPIKLSDNALFRVAEILQDFSLIDSSTDIKGRAFQKVLSSAIRAGLGQYFTPDPVVDMAVKLVQPKPSQLILDPFCGSGHFLTSCLDYVSTVYGSTVSEYTMHEFKFFHLHGIEKSERMVRIAMADMLMHGDGHTNIRNTDSLLSLDNYPDILALKDEEEEGDIQTSNESDKQAAIFDIILTNPPFGSKIRGEVLNMLGRFSLGQSSRRSISFEIIALERCFQFLKPGGILGIVLPDGLLKNKSVKYVRNWIHQVAEIKAVISLPIETFSPYGASVKTSLCFFKKYHAGESFDPNKPVFLAEVESLGYDATGRLKSPSEVDQVVAMFHQNIGWQ